MLRIGEASDCPKPAEGEALDRELAGLLEVETFDPPAEFREHALLNDPAVYEQAARDPQAWWAAQAEQLDWFEPWSGSSTTMTRRSTSGSLRAR